MTRKIISCPACNARFDVARYPPGSKVRCGRCSRVLIVPDEHGVVEEAQGPAAPVPSPATRSSSMPVPTKGSAPARKPEPPPAPMPSHISQKAEPSPAVTAIGTPSAPDRDPLLGRTINGQFRIVRKLGEGGYGAVYEAKDVNLERRIALKIMLPSRAASREYVAKFFREARTAAQLSHPNVVAVHGVGLDKDNNVYFLAMEYVEGRTLHDVLQERGPLPFETAIDYIVQSCRGLAAAHERNIIHRDIKPGNLMITPGGVIKITDFGLAKIYEGEGGAQSTVIGTPYFMPPEQFEGKAKDGRTDIYALGVTFYYLLTMQRAHSGAGPAQILLSVMTKEPVSVLEHRPDLPEGIWPIVRKMIERDPDRRYSNCNEIIADIEQLMGGGAEEVEQIYCPTCGAGNAVDASSCAGCRASLLEKCPVCGGEDAAGTKFCGNCGANIPAERAVAALVEEARQFLASGKIARAREKLQQAQERSTDNIDVAELIKEIDAKREQRDAHRDAIRELLARGRVAEAAERLKLAHAQFPDSPEILEIAHEVEAAAAGPETTGSTTGVSHVAAEARRLEDAGRIREALVAWRGVRLLVPNDEDAKAGEARTSERVEKSARLLAEGTELLRGGDPEAARARLQEADAVLPGDPLVEGRIKEASRLAQDLNSELSAIDGEFAKGRAAPAVLRLRALAERYPKSRDVAEALVRAESAGREANRGAVKERLERALASAKRHEDARRLRDAAQAWREAAALDPESSTALEGVARAERTLAEFDAMLAESRNLLSSGDPEGAERAAAEALGVIAGDPAAEAQLARARTQVETLRHEAERIRTALAGEPDDDVLTWAREVAVRYSGSSLASDVLRETEAKCKEAEKKEVTKRLGDRLARAAKLETDGALAQALRAYQEILNEAPDHADAKSAAARITDRVERAKRKAAEARQLLEDGDPDGARIAAEASLELLADQRESAGTLAGARTALAEIDRAAQSFSATLPVDRAEQQWDRLKRLAAKYPMSARCEELTKKAADSLAVAQEHALREKVRAHVDAAVESLKSGRLEEAEAACGDALDLDPGDASARETLEAVQERMALARTLVAEGRAAMSAGRLAEARDKFSAALEADPKLADAEAGRDAAVGAIERAAAEIATALERAVAMKRSGSPLDAAKAWERVVALDPSNATARDELSRLRAKIEKADSEVARARTLLDAGDPESAVAPLESARAVLGAGDVEIDGLLTAARQSAVEITKAARDLEAALASTDGDLDGVAAQAAALAAKFPASARAKDASTHAAAAAAERRRTLAVARVRKLVRDRRYGEARELAASLAAEGVRSTELDAAAAQAEQAIAKLEGLRQRAADARKAGRLVDARDALREVLVALPDDGATKIEITELDETIREVAARRDAAETARRRGAITQAIELYREALSLQGADPDIESEVTRLTGEVTERARILALCQEAVRNGDGRACATSAKQLLDKYPDDDDARDLQTTGDCMNRMVAALLSRATRQIDHGERAAASETIECLLRVAPGHPEALALLKR